MTLCHCCGAKVDACPLYTYQPFKLKYYASKTIAGPTGPTVTVGQHDYWVNEEYLDDILWDMKIKEITAAHKNDPFFRWCFMSPVRWKAHFKRLHAAGHKPVMRIGL